MIAAAQDAAPVAPEAALTNSVAQTNAEASTGEPAVSTAAQAGAPAATDANPASTNAAQQAKTANTNEIQLSFQGANIDMIAQWLAQTTGKSVIKHPQVQCQLTIMSSKKVTLREGIDLVYRALSLEGFTAIESPNSILIVPEGKEPKMNPEVLDASRTDIPEGRQRLVKLFPLANVQAADLREKLRGVLSDKGTLDIDDRANQLIATDYNDNLRLLAELIKDFDVPASGLTIQIYTLKHADAEELGNLLSLILNAQPPAPGSSSRSSSSSRNSGMPPGMPFPGGGPNPSDNSGGGPPPSNSSGSQNQTLQVRIWPDHSSNRLIVSAPKARFVELERLLLVLDTDKPDDVAVRVIPLKNVNATDLVREIGPLYQRISGKSTKEMIEVAANDRSNSLIILSSEANFRAIEKLVAGLDTEDALDKVIRTFPLKNADAEDVAKQLQDLNRDQDNNSRYPFYIFSSSRGGTPAKKMSVVSDRRRNSLVIQAPPAQMESIAKMIDELDAPVADDSLAPRIYHLKYVSAVDIEDVLNELFLKKTQQRSYWDFFGDSSEPTADHDVGRLYGKVRITSEPYSNTLIITSNSKESLAVLEGVLKELDAPSEAGESTLRIQLRFAKSADVANSINILFAKNGSPPLRPVNQQQQQQQGSQQNQQQQQQQQQNSYQNSFILEQEAKEEGYYPWLGGQPDSPRTADGRNPNRPVSNLVGRVRAVADPRSNALLISANVHFFPQVMKLIEDLDAPTAQVLIDARIVEVSSDFLNKLGVRWSPNGSQVFTADDYDNSLLASASAQYQKGFGGNTVVNSPNSLSLPSVLTQLRSGVLSGTVNIDYLVQFLRRTTDAKVLAEPQINIADNERGQLSSASRSLSSTKASPLMSAV